MDFRNVEEISLNPFLVTSEYLHITSASRKSQ